jgi:hypothetical protein
MCRVENTERENKSFPPLDADSWLSDLNESDFAKEEAEEKADGHVAVCSWQVLPGFVVCSVVACLHNAANSVVNMLDQTLE